MYSPNFPAPPTSAPPRVLLGQQQIPFQNPARPDMVSAPFGRGGPLPGPFPGPSGPGGLQHGHGPPFPVHVPFHPLPPMGEPEVQPAPPPPPPGDLRCGNGDRPLITPSNPELLKNIETLAAYVAKNGPDFEEKVRSNHLGDPNFSFLYGGPPGSEADIGAQFFQWKKRTLQGGMQQGNGKPPQPPSPSGSDMDMEMEDEAGNFPPLPPGGEPNHESPPEPPPEPTALPPPPALPGNDPLWAPPPPPSPARDERPELKSFAEKAAEIPRPPAQQNGGTSASAVAPAVTASGGRKEKSSRVSRWGPEPPEPSGPPFDTSLEGLAKDEDMAKGAPEGDAGAHVDVKDAIKENHNADGKAAPPIEVVPVRRERQMEDDRRPEHPKGERESSGGETGRPEREKGEERERGERDRGRGDRERERGRDRERGGGREREREREGRDRSHRVSKFSDGPLPTVEEAARREQDKGPDDEVALRSRGNGGADVKGGESDGDGEPVVDEFGRLIRKGRGMSDDEGDGGRGRSAGGRRASRSRSADRRRHEWRRSRSPRRARSRTPPRDGRERRGGEDRREWPAGSGGDGGRGGPPRGMFGRDRALGRGGNEACFDFSKGRCVRGSTCRFVHQMDTAPEQGSERGRGGSRNDGNWSGGDGAKDWGRPKVPPPAVEPEWDGGRPHDSDREREREKSGRERDRDRKRWESPHATDAPPPPPPPVEEPEQPQPVAQSEPPPSPAKPQLGPGGLPALNPLPLPRFSHPPPHAPPQLMSAVGSAAQPQFMDFQVFGQAGFAPPAPLLQPPPAPSPQMQQPWTAQPLPCPPAMSMPLWSPPGHPQMPPSQMGQLQPPWAMPQLPHQQHAPHQQGPWAQQPQQMPPQQHQMPHQQQQMPPPRQFLQGPPQDAGEPLPPGLGRADQYDPLADSLDTEPPAPQPPLHSQPSQAAPPQPPPWGDPSFFKNPPPISISSAAPMPVPTFVPPPVAAFAPPPGSVLGHPGSALGPPPGAAPGPPPSEGLLPPPARAEAGAPQPKAETVEEDAEDDGDDDMGHASPGLDNAWSPPPDVADEGGAGPKGDKSQRKARKEPKEKWVSKLKASVSELVKEALKPSWKEGNLSKDAFKTIARKAVEKVVGSLQPKQLPRSQENVDAFFSDSRKQKIHKLVQGYVKQYSKVH